ncbi:phosphatidylglycerophosphatase A [Chryseobacterium sp. CCH4-E10]|uniref:phosphatidylglycerophosphatase A family protein n=1 Tax=Chryseobacterium sp. CCH4-E10 TaxID=1768758 RepID=UPI00082A5AEF|nr:phosphatidylglycerophosphatase A [Chryseobacterium sp. CCH4-E10]
MGHKIFSLLATIGPIGYVKGGGSIAAAFAAVCWYLFMSKEITLQIFSVGVIFFIGVWSSNKLEEQWGKDSNKIVIDEVLGMMVSLLFLPISIKVILTGFFLFRFFDITKVLGIKKSENLPKGWGVMTDDLCAGIYANLIMQILVYFNIF